MPTERNEFLADGLHDEMAVEIGSHRLKGLLGIAGAQPPRALVIFAHGSGSSRFSPRNGYVSARLRHAGFATLLLDLLTAANARGCSMRPPCCSSGVAMKG
jgi:predicted alpha/beta-hydrolase family hydrolase